MTAVRQRVLQAVRIAVASLPLVAAHPLPAAAATKTGGAGVPRALTAAFEFPASLGDGASGSLVAPADTASALQFQHGTVAIGVMPVPRPVPLSVLRHARDQLNRHLFMLSPDPLPHARLLLEGVTGADGMPAGTTGTLVIDAAVSPAAAGSPPFSLPFEIHDGIAFLDAALPIQPQPDQAVRVEIRGVAVQDAGGQVFGVLGFTVAAAAPTPTPGGTPPVEGACFVGSDCVGPSFPSSQEKCCRLIQPSKLMSELTSWCPPDQFDAGSGTCAANACVSCAPQTPPPDCGDQPICGGVCKVVCVDGHVAVGICQQQQSCSCAADCTPAPTATPEPTWTPGPCDTGSTCGGPCPFTCADGTAVTGECMTLLTPGNPAEPRGPICACRGECPQPPTPTPGPSGCGSGDSCGGACTGICADGSTAPGECVPVIFNGPIILPGGPIPPRGCQCIPQDCSQSPTPTPGPNGCGSGDTCGGSCQGTCPDGSTAPGKCVPLIFNGPILPGSGPIPPGSGCQCITECAQPPPLPHGTICCQCGTPVNECFDLNWVEVTPACPDGCETMVQGTCDDSTHTCTPPTPCTTDSDCTDDNSCTIDRCDGGVCEHDCVCLAPGACGPGPGVANPKP